MFGEINFIFLVQQNWDGIMNIFFWYTYAS